MVLTEHLLAQAHVLTCSYYNNILQIKTMSAESRVTRLVDQPHFPILKISMDFKENTVQSHKLMCHSLSSCRGSCAHWQN